MLFGGFFAAATALGQQLAVAPDADRKLLVVVGAGLAGDLVFQHGGRVLLDDLLQTGLVVVLGGLALGDEGQDEIARGLHAAVQIQRGNDRLERIGDDARAAASAAKVLAVAKAGDEPEGNIRILSGRGPGGFGISLKECPESSLYIAAYRVPPRTDAWYDKGLTAFRSDVPVKPAMFARLKTTNYLSAVFMTLEAMQKHMDVALTFDANGCLTEAAIANVAVVDAKGALVLPEFKNALVGTVATKAMELAKTFMPVEIRPIPQAELDSVREMMILGTAHECIGVTHFEGRPIGDGKTGPVAHKLRKLIREDLLAGGEAF